MNSHIAVTNTDGAMVRRRTIHSDQVIWSEQSELRSSARAAEHTNTYTIVLTVDRSVIFGAAPQE